MLRELVGIHKGLEKWRFPRGKIKKQGGVQERELAATKRLVKWQPRVSLPQVHLWDQPSLRCPGRLPIMGKSGSEEQEHAGHC